jgi:hypothetical protein
MSNQAIYFDFESSDDAVSEFDTVACILDALADRFAWNPYLYGFLITRAHQARMIEEYIQKNPLDTDLRGA